MVGKRNAADSQGNPEVINWRAFGQLTQNVIGQRIDKPNLFGPRFEANPSYAEICSFDPQGVKLKTSTSQQSDQTMGNEKGRIVSQMAKRATASARR